jgi:seryl-tRNA synthetase
MDTKELEKKLEGIKGRITANRSNTTEAEKRKGVAIEKLEDYQSRYEKAREERQGLLASGKDVKKTNESIKIMQTDKELAEDEVIGLDKMLADLSDEAKALEQEEREAERDILKSKLLPLVPAYNEAAARLAAIVENIWELRYALEESHSGPQTIYSAMGWSENGLMEIPKLFLIGGPEPDRYSVEAVHFSVRLLIDKRRKERERLAELRRKTPGQELPEEHIAA